MVHKILAGPNPCIKIMEITGSLDYAAMTAVNDLKLDEGPVYVLLDVSRMNVGLPEGFLDGARHSYFTHPNLGHMALYTDSALLSSVGKMVAKLTGRKDKLTVHTNYQEAMAHLIALTQKANL